MTVTSFNPRVLAGGRDVMSPIFAPHSLFQSTRPRGRTRRVFAACTYCVSVSIHASSREDATNVDEIAEAVAEFQSTRPRGRTRPVAETIKPVSTVSIHASSREDATYFINSWLSVAGFNPRVLAGGRDVTFCPLRPKKLFQSTRPRGRTRHPFAGYAIRVKVSIHASSREDATHSRSNCTHDASFNPRVLAGGRDHTSNPKAATHRFQSTRPRGRTRLYYATLRPMHFCFNPRVLAGGRDGNRHALHTFDKVSIHASSREDATVSVESNINQNVTFAKARRK